MKLFFLLLLVIFYFTLIQNKRLLQSSSKSDAQIILDDLYYGNNNPYNSSPNDGDSICDFYICENGHGYCITINNNSICLCHPDYDTYPSNNILRCNYKKKSQIISFLLELFFVYGIGHFYIGNYKYAICKLLCFLFSYCLFIILKNNNKINQDENTYSLLICIIASIFCIGMITWQLFDLLLFGLNKHLDENGISLASW
jgi:hypothetical protein